ncbi:MAG: hypothetical protein J0L62_09660 [Bacteroidetes bacterium]|nr:hypothetical protein [Bacteroidota bacterium]
MRQPLFCNTKNGTPISGYVGSEYETLGLEGLARVMEHEPIHHLMEKWNISVGDDMKYNDYIWDDSTILLKDTGKYEGGVVHMKPLEEEIKEARKQLEKIQKMNN